MAKVNINEEQLKSIISESVKKVLSECVNEGFFDTIRGRTQDSKVDKYIKSIGGGRYMYSSTDKCYVYVSKNENKRVPTGIGYNRVLWAGSKVSDKEKREVIRQLKEWDFKYSSKIEQGIWEKEWISNFGRTQALNRPSNSNSNPNYDYDRVNGNTIDLNNVNNDVFKLKQQSRFKNLK